MNAQATDMYTRSKGLSQGTSFLTKSRPKPEREWLPELVLLFRPPDATSDREGGILCRCVGNWQSLSLSKACAILDVFMVRFTLVLGKFRI